MRQRGRPRRKSKGTVGSASVSSNPRTSDKDVNEAQTAMRPTTQPNNKDKLSKQAEVFDSLHKEMEVAVYARCRTGQLRRKVPKEQSVIRTRKRKLLEQADDYELAIEADDDYDDEDENSALHGTEGSVSKPRRQPRRLRGSRLAIEEEIVKGSMIFASEAIQRPRPAAQQKQPAIESMYSEATTKQITTVTDEKESKNPPIAVEGRGRILQEHDHDDEFGAFGKEEDAAVDTIPAAEDDEDEDEDEDSDDNEDEDDGGDIAEGDDHVAGAETDALHAAGSSSGNPQTQSSRKVSTGGIKSRSRRSRRKMFRLKNFKSQRMARRHGDALAAHARGHLKEAIQLLKMVAEDAPSAPQIYSSLAMVYEDMLRESRRRAATEMQVSVNGRASNPSEANRTGINVSPASPPLEKSDDRVDEIHPDHALAEQLDFAKKAYGSYHIAAILCKKDFTLWLRAADAGSAVATIHGQFMLLPNISPELSAFHRSEQSRWNAEVLRDFKAADNLKPPGIDVPAKLAAMHIELGNLSEALTILTDLKNRHDKTILLDSAEKNGAAGTMASRGEFQSSYKAWLLYADLMLRIGHECIQWNRGVETNNNYMFRRWLRKYSDIFDWQERRLQALCLALEASAGTKSTLHFLTWMQRRTHEIYLKSQQESKTTDANQDCDTAGDATKVAESEMVKERDVSINDDSSKPVESEANGTEQLETEREMLLERQHSELKYFDKTTFDMSLDPNSAASEDRQSNRKKLLKAHEEALAMLDRDYIQDDEKKNASVGVEGGEIVVGVQVQVPLTMSASCRQVCAIASELMKHLHGLELFEGARLVGEAVADYLKERADKHDRRIKASKRMDAWQQKLAESPFFLEPFDEGSDSENSDGLEAIPMLSDDEDLEQDDNFDVLNSLRKGILPPELRVLYGLALLAEGGKNFLAAKYLEAIDDLEQETEDWLTQGERETDRAGSPLWYLFRRAMTEPLGRTAAFAFVADVLRKTNKERVWAVHFAKQFRLHLRTLEEVGLTEQLMSLRESVSPFVNLRKNQLLKIILAACSFDVDAAISPAKKSPADRTLIVTNESERIGIAISALKSLSEVLYLMWKVESDGSLPQICLEVVKTSSRCLRWLSREAKELLSYSQIHSIIDHARIMISFFCGDGALPEFKGTGAVKSVMKYEWGSFPISASWQASEYRRLSLRIYNISVGCNVSLFSGWEPEEFTLRLLRRRHGHKHFGVYLRERRIAGYLSSILEGDINDQWKEIHTILPSFPDVKFAERLKSVKKTEWYKTEKTEREKDENLQGSSVDRYAENEAGVFYVAFSALCLQLAHSEDNPNVKNRLLQASLSILLPVTQFCVDDRLWNSDIGEAVCSLSGFDEWKLMTGSGFETAIERLNVRRPRRRKADRVIEKKVQEWIEGTDEPTLRSYIKLPTKELNRQWCMNSEAKSKEETELARQCMQKVHKATVQLRSCFTEMAAEKASLQLAVILLELASLPGCSDPFLCLQQATLFATQASKAGNSDMAFRAKLPEKKKCTPLQALTILGRADCLHSVYFPSEAAFLCCYVALVCRLHRDSDENTLGWNERWRIVGIYAYNVSVMIRTTVSTVLDKAMQKSFLSIWDRDVVEELELARSDGQIWRRSLYGRSLVQAPELDDVYNDLDVDVEDEDNDVVSDEVDIIANQTDSNDGRVYTKVGRSEDDSDSMEAADDKEDFETVRAFASTPQVSVAPILPLPITVPMQMAAMPIPTENIPAINQYADDSNSENEGPSFPDIEMVSV